MKLTKLILLLCLLPFYASAEALTDRQRINQVMDSFYQWDHTGGTHNAENSLAHTVRYNRLDEGGKHIAYSIDFNYEGKGKNAYQHFIAGLDIYGKMAVVRSIHYHAGKGSYLKTFILHKLTQGWRITNVSWGKITPEE